MLRALDRFDLISWQGTLDPIARAILAGIAFATGAPFAAYVAIWFVTDLGGDLFLWFLAWRELRRRGLLKGIRPTLRPTTLPGAWRFAIHVNLTVEPDRPPGARSRGWSSAACSARPERPSSASPPASPTARRSRPTCSRKAFYPEVVRMDLVDQEAVEADAARHGARGGWSRSRPC